MRILDWLARLRFPPRGVRLMRQSRPGNCVQTVIAMSVGVPVEAVESLAGTQGPMETGEILHLLAKLGVFYRPVSSRLMADCWPSFWRRSGGARLRGMGVRRPDAENRVGHAYFIAGQVMYDPATGETRAMNPATLVDVDWLALFPEDIQQSPALESLRRAFPASARGSERRESAEKTPPPLRAAEA